jgi:uncharacterized protein (TIGR02599 family)
MKNRNAFSLIELLVAVVVLVIMLAILFSVLSSASNIWRGTNDRIEAFQGARAAFDVIGRNLSRATLNTYFDYDSPNDPTRYFRQSELKFRSGPAGGSLPGTPSSGQAVFFQFPGSYTTNQSSYGGLKDLLNTCGYYVSFTTNTTIPAHVSNSGNPFRYRLMQLLAPSEATRVYDPVRGNGDKWFADLTNHALPVADNIIALIIRLQDPAAALPDVTSDYQYDSTAGATNDPQPVTANQLPPIAQITLVAIDEPSAKRLENGSTPPAAIAAAFDGKFETQTDTAYLDDLSKIKEALTAANINFRIFTASVSIAESKWSR